MRREATSASTCPSRSGPTAHAGSCRPADAHAACTTIRSCRPGTRAASCSSATPRTLPRNSPLMYAQCLSQSTNQSFEDAALLADLLAQHTPPLRPPPPFSSIPLPPCPLIPPPSRAKRPWELRSRRSRRCWHPAHGRARLDGPRARRDARRARRARVCRAQHAVQRVAGR